MTRTFKHLTETDRVKIETLLNKKTPIREIAYIIKTNISTIYRELKRGEYYKRDSLYRNIKSYSSDLAQMRYTTNLKAKGVGIKLGKDLELANYIEKKISEENYSPAAVLGEIKNLNIKFNTSICVTTLYSYIDKGVFLSVSNKQLPTKGKRKRKYRVLKRTVKSSSMGDSIEKRSKYILNREEFGHWEMDTVKGKRTSKSSLLVLTERKTRKEIIFKLDEHSAQSVVDKVNLLEAKLNNAFYKIFKTITCDNGKEFSYCKEIERSIANRETHRVSLYYCHPYSSYERGTNEVTNRLIRRFIPKGTDFDKKPVEEIKAIEDWINNYPRKIFGFKTANQMFDEELKLLL